MSFPCPLSGSSSLPLSFGECVPNPAPILFLLRSVCEWRKSHVTTYLGREGSMRSGHPEASERHASGKRCPLPRRHLCSADQQDLCGPRVIGDLVSPTIWGIHWPAGAGLNVPSSTVTSRIFSGPDGGVHLVLSPGSFLLACVHGELCLKVQPGPVS